MLKYSNWKYLNLQMIVAGGMEFSSDIIPKEKEANTYGMYMHPSPQYSVLWPWSNNISPQQNFNKWG